MEEPIHILDNLIEKISSSLDSEVKVYLAMNEEEKEVLAIKHGELESGLDLTQIVNSYGFYRIYQTDNEEEAITRLAETLVKSIKEMLDNSITSEKK